MNSAENVSVRPLEWKDLGDGKSFRALLPIIGSVRIEPYGVCGWWEVLWSMPGQCDKLIPDVFNTPDEAKAAAQADYEQRVLSCLRSPPTEDADRVEPVAWGSGTIDRLQRAIMDDDEAVRERAAENVAVLYAHSVAPYAAALAMVREAIGELFGPIASIESEDATLLRGPEPHHEAEAQIAALRRVSASPTPETVGVSDAMVERAARALCIEDGRDPDSLDKLFMCDKADNPLPAWMWWEDHARAALTAALSPQEGE